MAAAGPGPFESLGGSPAPRGGGLWPTGQFTGLTMAQTNGHRGPRPQGLSQHCFALGMWGGNALLASVPCPLASVIQFHLPAPWEQEGQFQPPSSLWWRKMWIRGELRGLSED